MRPSGTAPRAADSELRIAGAEGLAFTAPKALRSRPNTPTYPQYADLLGGAPPRVPPNRGMGLELETGDEPMPRPRPVKPRSDGVLEDSR